MADQQYSAMYPGELPHEPHPPSKPRWLRPALAWAASLSLIGGLALGLIAAVNRAQEAAARSH